MSPPASPNTGTVRLVVNGSGYLPGSSVRLVRSGQPDVPGDDVINGTNVAHDSPSLLHATFDLTTRSPGGWDVKVTQVDGTGACAGCFVVAAAKPTVSAVTPGSRGQGAADQQLVIAGTNFARGATVEASGTGLTFAAPHFDGPTQLTVVEQVAADAPAGPRDIRVRNTDTQAGTCLGCFTVNGAPRITSPITPNSRGQGATNQDVVLHGSNFVAGASLSFGPDVTVNTTTVNGPGSLTANVSVSSTAAPVARDVTVTNGDGGLSDACHNCFTVNTAPTVASGYPVSLGQGATARTVTITGANFVDGAIVSFSGTAISVADVSFGGGTSLVAHVSIDPNALAGSRDIIVTNPDAGTGTCSGCFTVNPHPVVSNTAPSSRGQGAASTLTITGTGFTPGASASFAGAGITVNDTTYVSPTQLSADIAVADDAPAGASDVTVSNTDAGIGACAGCFTVNAKPTVATATPGALGQGATAKDVTISGNSFEDGATVSFSGTGATVNSPTFVNATTLVANVTISGASATGLRDVTVKNPDGGTQATCTGCFRVNPAPSIAVTGGFDPASRGRGATEQDVKIHGTDFVTGATASFSGTGISVTNVTFDNPQELALRINVDRAAGIGPHDVVVTNPDFGNATCASCFTVAPAPAVTSTSPAAVGQGASGLDVTIVGAGFVDGATSSFGASDVVVNSTTYSSPTTLVANITVDKNAVTGSRPIVVTNADGGTSACDCFAVTAAPRVGSMAPAGLNRGAANRVLTLTGTAYTGATTVDFSGTGITLNSLTHQNATTLVANVSLGSASATGPRDVTLTNADGGRSVCSGCFTIGDGPAVNQVSPPAALNDGPVTVTMDGNGFVAGTTAVLKFPGQPDISGTAVTPLTGGTQLHATFDLTWVAPGTRTLVVAAPDVASDSCRCFAVAQSAPHLDSLSPSAVPQGANGLEVTLNGTGFAPGSTVSVSGAGVSVGTVNVQSPTQMKAPLTVDPAAATGSRDMTVTNTDGQDHTCTGCLTLNPRPVIVSSLPASEAQGAAGRQLTITGDHFANGSTVSFSGAGITVSSVAFTPGTPDQLVAVYSIASNAAIGKRDVDVTNPDAGRAVCTECFTVKSTPTIASASPASIRRGGTAHDIVLTGTNFVDGATASFSGTGITTNSTSVLSATSLRATIAVAIDAPLTARDVTMHNPDGGTATCASCFAVIDVQGRADFNGDGKTDILWHNTQTGQVVVWLMNGTQYVTGTAMGGRSSASLDWTPVATGDFNADGKPDILWHNTQTGQVVVWLMNGTQFVSATVTGGRSSAALAWTPV